MPYDNRKTYQNSKKEENDSDFIPFFPDGKLEQKWIREKAIAFSKKFADRGMNKTTIRNFYNEMLRIKDIKASTDEKKALIRLLIAKVNFKNKQKNSHVPNEFVDFITKLVTEIDDDLDRFSLACFIMEAIIGYYPENPEKLRR
ncbi:MAG TPA: type III-A CRISPR-associated protein Csm2 [Candidatus Cloacimonadota bacterium]|nr:type III-A CRISPR-associated protein Csm2 [Candidatus Cloacimonadota bacterium]HQL15381.1 type III-A CRISPR-associated protein Csm2 [Candidatus Cloacimonadota bacterium]